jgi:hypothetical protein
MRFTLSPDVWLQSLPSQNHQLKAWQKWASMYALYCKTINGLKLTYNIHQNKCLLYLRKIEK